MRVVGMISYGITFVGRTSRVCVEITVSWSIKLRPRLPPTTTIVSVFYVNRPIVRTAKTERATSLVACFIMCACIIHVFILVCRVRGAGVVAFSENKLRVFFFFSVFPSITQTYETIVCYVVHIRLTRDISSTTRVRIENRSRITNT